VIRDASQYADHRARPESLLNLAERSGKMSGVSADSSPSPAAATTTPAAPVARAQTTTQPMSVEEPVAATPQRTTLRYAALPPVGRDAATQTQTRAKSSPPPADAGPMLSASTAIRIIRTASQRDQISDAVAGFLRKSFGAGLMLVAKEDKALGLRGCGGNFDDASVESILVPLTLPSMFSKAVESQKVFRGIPPSTGHAVQDPFFKLFPLSSPPREVIVVPVILRDRVVCMIYAHAKRGGALSGKAISDLEKITSEISEAYLRLIRAAKQQ
jgi:hypothetical protein